VSLDFLALGLALTVAAVWVTRRKSPGTAVPGLSTPAIACAILLVAGGIFVYLPMSMISGRYAMPGVWGLDILFALLLSRLVAVPDSTLKKAAFAGVCAGLAAVMIANVGRQEKFAARAKMLWDALHHVEATAPRGSKLAWVSGDSLRGGLNVEEGIHFQWHLYHRGRGDVQVGLFDETGSPLDRTELPRLAGEPDYRMYGVVAADPPKQWEEERAFAAAFWLGRKRYDCHLSRRAVLALAGGAGLKEQLTGQLLHDLRDPVTARILAGRDTLP
jgi:hypothetical protein